MPHPWLPAATQGTAGHAALLANHRQWGWGAANRLTCRATTRKGARCGGPVLFDCDLCRRHAGPVASRARQARELREFEAGRISPEQWARSQVRRTRNRISNQRRRVRDGWLLPGLTLAFGPELEGAFQGAARVVLCGLAWDTLPDPTRDRLRWGWRRYQLDRDRPEAWQAKAAAVLLDLATHGPIPDGIEHDPGTGAHVVVVDRRPSGFSLRTTITEAELGKAKALPGKVRARLAKQSRPAATRAAPAPLDVDAFLAVHGRDLRGVLARAGSDADVHAIALAHRAVLAREPGAHEAWVRLLRRLDQDAGR